MCASSRGIAALGGCCCGFPRRVIVSKGCANPLRYIRFVRDLLQTGFVGNMKIHLPSESWSMRYAVTPAWQIGLATTSASPPQSCGRQRD